MTRTPVQPEAVASASRAPCPLTVALDGHHVLVYSTIPEVVAGVESIFAHMLAQEPAHVVGRLEVRRSGEGYSLWDREEKQLARGSLWTVLDALRHQAAQYLIVARRDLIWFHAAAAAKNGQAVMLLGAFGHGKSTLVTSLCAHGWTYFSDDLVPLDPTSNRILSFPQTPMIREDAGRNIDRDVLYKLSKTQVQIDSTAVGREPAPVSAFFFPAYSKGPAARLEPCSPANAVLGLMGNCLNLKSHEGALVPYLCDLVKSRAAFRLPFSNGQAAAQLVAGTSERLWDESL
jgi:hypothetical protein